MRMSEAEVLPFRWRPEVSFNERLRLVRKGYGQRVGRPVRQEEMAELLGEKVGTYKTWEASGKPRDLSAFARKVERITGADPAWLLGVEVGPDTPGGQAGSPSPWKADVVPLRALSWAA